MTKRLLIMEGNTRARQAEAAALGCRSASEIYAQSILAHFPHIKLDIVHAADRGESLPGGASFSDYDGLVVGGSGLRAFDDTFEVRNQVEMLKSFCQTGRPVLGSCWGLQIAAIAGGGSVGPSPNGREFGFARKLRLNASGQNHPFFKAKGAVFDAPCIHYDEVTALPSGAEVLCSNDHSAVQGAVLSVEKSEVWAVQYHPEFDLEQLSMLMTLYCDDLIKQGFFQERSELTSYQLKMDALAASPSNESLAWQLGIDADIVVPERRRAEIINWIDAKIL